MWVCVCVVEAPKCVGREEFVSVLELVDERVEFFDDVSDGLIMFQVVLDCHT